MQVLSRRKLATHVVEQLQAGTDARVLTEQVAAYLVAHRRVNQAELLVRDIEAILAENGHVIANVVSARELSAGLQAAIKTFVASAEGATAVEVKSSVDPSLIGGVVIRTPSSEIDLSIRKKLNALKV